MPTKINPMHDSINGLLDEMLYAYCINKQQKHEIEEQTTDENKNKTLYNIVLWGSLASYNSFIRCLLKTNPNQVVSLLEPSLIKDTSLDPLNSIQQCRIQKNYPTLKHLLNSQDSHTAELYAAGCIIWLQKEYIESAAKQSESNKRLIDIVIRESQINFHKFITCLDETGQRHVSRILIEDGTIAHIVATISPKNIREQQERRILDQLTALLRDVPDEHRVANERRTVRSMAAYHTNCMKTKPQYSQPRLDTVLAYFISTRHYEARNILEKYFLTSN